MACVPERSSQDAAAGSERLERAIVLALLAGEREQRWPYAQLGVELGADSQTLQQALVCLARAGVVELDGATVSASSAVRHVDELGLIGI